jgi:sucrose phosphorylase
VGITDEPEAIDVDVTSPLGQQFLKGTLHHLKQNRIQIIRLDAVGYAIKKAGTSCFFVEPEIYSFLDGLRTYATSLGLTLLPDMHVRPELQTRLAARGYWIYDYVLPLLVLHTFFERSSEKLQRHLRHAPRRQFTMLDAHDGIPVQPDLDGVLTTDESKAVVDRLRQRGANLSRLHAWEQRGRDFDAHQVNITYYSALGADDDAYIAARAIQLFAPGVPQIYYVGLLAGGNDLDAVDRTGDGRAINRHTYTPGEITAAVKKPVVQRLIRLIRFRNGHSAFQGRFQVRETSDRRISLTWDHNRSFCTLEVDLETFRSEISYREDKGTVTSFKA